MRRLPIVLLAVVATVALISGCGGSEVDDSPSGTVSSSSTTGTSTAVTGPAVVSSSAIVPSTAIPTRNTPPPAMTVTTPPGTSTRVPVTSTPSTSTGPGTTSITTPPGGNTPSSTTPTEPVRLPAVGLPGVNDPDCADDRPPVVLLHGTFSTASANFGPVARALREDGRCVYAIDYGWGGTGAVTTSAAQVARFVDKVLAATGAEQIDVVGYSQGGLVLRTALRENDLAPLVRTAALISPSFHGTTLTDTLGIPDSLCPACVDQTAGSELLRRLDAGGDLDGDVRYSVLSTRNDTIVIPVSSQVPNGPPDRVNADIVEDLCPGIVTDHIALVTTRAATTWTVATLDSWPADPAQVTC